MAELLIEELCGIGFRRYWVNQAVKKAKGNKKDAIELLVSGTLMASSAFISNPSYRIRQQQNTLKETNDSDDDGFPDDFDVTHIKATATAEKQQGDMKYDVDLGHLQTWDRRAKPSAMIQCTGQLLMWNGKYEDEKRQEKSLVGGTATIIKKMSYNNYFMALTCGHNFVEYDAINKKRIELSPKRIWLFPKGALYTKCKLHCIKTAIYHKYDASKGMCPNDLAVALVYNKKGEDSEAAAHFKDVDVNGSIVLAQCEDSEAWIGLWGYPTKSNGKLQGQDQREAIAEDGIWKYNHTLYTYPGHSGAALYERKKRKFYIYGIHTYGEVTEQNNCGIVLDADKLKWIQSMFVEFEQMVKELAPAIDDRAKVVESDETNNEEWFKSLSEAELKVRSWFRETVHLDDNDIHILLDEEYDDIKDIESLTEDELKTMKLKNGNIKKIMHYKNKGAIADMISAEQWLTHIVGVKEDVVAVLFNQGYDDMVAIQCLEEEDLKELKMKKGHIVTIMHHVAHLKKGTKAAEKVSAQKWLKNTVELRRNAIDILLENGYDDMVAVKSLEEKDLKEMKMKKGQIKKLIRHVERANVAPPKCHVKVGYSSAVIAIASSKEMSEYKLVYHQRKDCDNSKAQWTTIYIKNGAKRYEMKALKLMTSYVVRAAAKSNVAWSYYSKPFVFETLPAPPQFEVENVGVSSAIVAIALNKEMIEYKFELGEEDGDDTKTRTISIKNEAKPYELKALKPSTSYVIRAAAKSNVGWSYYSKTYVFQTLPPPPHFELKNVKCLSAVIVFAANKGIDIVEYNLEYKVKDDVEAEWTAVSIKNGTKSYELKELKATTSYVVRAAAKSNITWSVYSKTCVFKTKTPPPLPVIELAEVGFETATVAVVSTKGITEYKAQYHQSKDEKASWKTLLSPNNVCSLVALEPNTAYIVRGAAKNTGGWSAFSSTLNFKTLPPPPGFEVKNVRCSSAVIVFDANKESVNYKLAYKSDENNKTTQWSKVCIKNGTKSYELKELKPMTSYVVCAAAQSDTTWSPYSKPCVFKTKPQVTVKQIGISSAVITLVASKESVGYKLEYDCGAQVKTVYFENVEYAIGSLTSNTTYRVRGAAENNDGWSVLSELVVFKTLPSPPQFTLKNVECLSAVIVFAKNKGIVEYNVEYKVYDDEYDADEKAGWTTVSIKNGMTSYLLEPLKPMTSYVMRAAAKNDIAWSSYSEAGLFKTKTPPPPPVIQVKQVGFETANIVVVAKKSIEYKAQYIKSKYRNSKKANWKTLKSQKWNQSDGIYSLEELKPNTAYSVRGATRNKNGWSELSEPTTFKTKKVQITFVDWEFTEGPFTHIINEGYTMENNCDGPIWRTTLCGEFLTNETGGMYKVEFELEEGRVDGLGVGFVTPDFQIQLFKNMDEESSFFQRGDGRMNVYNPQLFDIHGDRQRPLFRGIGDTMVVLIDMYKQIATLNGMAVELPESVCVAIFSFYPHKISIVE